MEYLYKVIAEVKNDNDSELFSSRECLLLSFRLSERYTTLEGVRKEPSSTHPFSTNCIVGLWTNQGWTESTQEIELRIVSADLILLLVSPDFMSSSSGREQIGLALRQ